MTVPFNILCTIDKAQCTLSKCKICELLENDVDCSTQYDHFQQFYNRRNIKVHVPIIMWSHCVAYHIQSIKSPAGFVTRFTVEKAHVCYMKDSVST